MRGILGNELIRVDGGSSDWWDPDGSIGCCVGAYQARNVADYVTSLVNLANPGVNDLVEGNGAVPWGASTGWAFVAAQLKYLDTGWAPGDGWSLLVQYDNLAAAGGTITGVLNAPGRYYFVKRRPVAEMQYGYANVAKNRIPQLLTGNIGQAGSQGYRNGVADGAPGGVWVAGASVGIYIGARHDAVAGDYITGNVWAEAIFSCTLTAPQVALVAAAMAAL